MTDTEIVDWLCHNWSHFGKPDYLVTPLNEDGEPIDKPMEYTDIRKKIANIVGRELTTSIDDGSTKCISKS